MPDEATHFSPNSLYDNEPPESERSFKIFGLLTGIFLLLALFSIVTYSYLVKLNQPPDNFPINTPITIEPGTEVREITKILQRANVVKSDNLLYYLIVLWHEPTNLKASTYLFTESITAKEVAQRLTEGDFDTDLIRFTHYEGERVRQLAKRASDSLPNFDYDRFIVNAEPLEGKLFPDTYFIPQKYTDEELLTLMLNTFNDQVKSLTTDIESHSLSLDEILVLASIVEREANTPESKKMVAGILLNRLEIDMALQADASMEYVLDKPLSELTPDDLETDSPYNTYLYPGLPPTPIGNPGLDAITAVLYPTTSDYFYYITGNDGEFYYAETYSGHLRNIEVYLR